MIKKTITLAKKTICCFKSKQQQVKLKTTEAFAPLESYYSFGEIPMLTYVPTKACRLSIWGRKSPTDIHPLTVVAKKEINGSELDDFKISPLEQTYKALSTVFLPEFLDIPKETVPGLNGVGILGAVYPWSKDDPIVRFKKNSNISKRKNRERILALTAHGVNQNNYAKIAANNELQYLISLYNSIKNNGYNRHNGPDGDIMGVILHCTVSNQNIVHIVSGQHRFVVLDALGYEKIPVRVFQNKPGIIRKNESRYWPQVKNGVFKTEGAIKVFELLFNAP